MYGNNQPHGMTTCRGRVSAVMKALTICLPLFAAQSAVAAGPVELSTPVSRVGNGEGGLRASLQPVPDGSGTLEMTAWATPRLLGDYAQTNAIALLTDAQGTILMQAAFSCRRHMRQLAQTTHAACQQPYKISRDILARASYLFIFNTLCVWQQASGQPTRVAGCVAEGDTVQQAAAFATQTLPALLDESSLAVGGQITAGAWRGVRLR
ncbi:hypothetical protein P7L75_19390 [Tistrella mobilis]|uniref:hypothetical protein n=1 Tax=Tistrella mobilis TaxID=171437 RepID=UPI003556B0E1